MIEEHGDFTENDEFSPCMMLISEGVQKDNIATTSYQINVECDLDETLEEVLEEFGLENSGYTLESAAIAFLENEYEDLLEQIEGFDTESSTFVAYLFSEEGMRNIAQALQKLFTEPKLFRKTVKQNLGFIRDRYD